MLPDLFPFGVITRFFSSIISMKSKFQDAIFLNRSIKSIAGICFLPHGYSHCPIFIIIKQLSVLIAMLWDCGRYKGIQIPPGAKVWEAKLSLPCEKMATDLIHWIESNSMSSHTCEGVVSCFNASPPLLGQCCRINHWMPVMTGSGTNVYVNVDSCVCEKFSFGCTPIAIIQVHRHDSCTRS